MTQFIIVFIISISFSAGFLFGVFWVAVNQNKDHPKYVTGEGSEKRGGINPIPSPQRPSNPPPSQPKK